MKSLIRLSRELVENLLNRNKQKLGKEYFFMFSISKFILLKERILKKDSANNILYFNNVKDAKYIPDFNKCVSYIKNNIQENDIVMTLGAGTVTEIGPLLLEK